MMYPRILLAKQLLREDGVIFVSIDDNEVHNLRILMNEIFGEENFAAQFVIKSNPRGSQSNTFSANVHEYLLCYLKNTQAISAMTISLSEDMIEEYKYEDEKGKYRLLGLRLRGGAWRREQRPLLYFPIFVDPKTGSISLSRISQHTYEALPIKPSTGEEGTWRWSQTKISKDLDKLIAKKVTRDGIEVWDIYQKDYVDDDGGSQRGTKAKTIWDEKEFNYQNGTNEIKALFEGKQVFDFPKPIALIKRMLELGSDDQSIILDFFAGSCTTAHAVLQLNREDGGNRSFLAVQLPELTPVDSTARKAGYNTIADIGKERIRRVIEKLKKDNSKEDLSFKVFKLDHSNFKAWKDYQGEDVKQLEMLFIGAETPLVEGWTSESLLTEVLLIQGFPLDSKITMQPEFKKNKVQLIESNASAHRLFVCLDDKVHEETEKALKVNSGDIFICLDSAITDQAKMRLANICTLATI